MTKEEKTQLYSLLKTVSDSLYGHKSPDFPDEIPIFEDDMVQVQAETTETQNTASTNAAQSESVSSAGGNSATSTIDNISSKIRECKRCQLCASRKQTVPGMGVEKPFVLVIGEGPGEEEDKQGLPFVGPAGQLLDKMLAAIQLYRNKNCYIANIVKCRPPMNRNPMPEEADACRPFLDAQIAALKPKAILCAGSVAVKNLFHINDGVMKLHGQVLDYKGIPVVTTWHPSALLRAPENKRPAWEDLKIFKSELLKLDPNYDK
ncbi:MAG: uracil-DNA glycosylase [Treponema sp.]|nr:uracil-DNA glycosylase [Candidatus Treponema equifaecale]